MPQTKAQNEQTKQELPNTAQTIKDLDKRVQDVIDTNSFTAQIKTTLEVAWELVKTFAELNEHYASDMEKFNANHLKSEQLYNDFVAQKETFEASYDEILATLNEKSESFANSIQKVESVQNEIAELEKSLQAMAANISKQKDEIQRLVNSLDMPTIDKKTQILTQKAAQIEAFLPQFDAKKAEIEQLLPQIKTDLEQWVAQFRESLDEIDFVQETAPLSGLNGQSWLDTSKGLINIFSANSKVRFAQSAEPTNFARLGDAWCKSENENEQKSLFVFKTAKSLNEWQALQMNAFEFDKIDFKQLDEVDANAENEGKAWLKMDALKVYYLENKSFVQIDKKLVRFTSDTEPNSASETIQLNDIWKKSESEVYICTSYTPKVPAQEGSEQTQEIPAKAEWTLLELAYKHAKFKRASLPRDDEIANDDETGDLTKIQMRDLVFVFDENELYYCLKTSYDGTNNENAEYAWVKKADLIANARFKGALTPQELFENDLWFKTKSDDKQSADGTSGVLKVLKPKNPKAQWRSIAWVKKYAAFKSEVRPDTKYCKDYDAWYRPYSDELYIFYNGYFNFVNKCNAFMPFVVEMKPQAESTPQAAESGAAQGEQQETPPQTKTLWKMRKFQGWQSIAMPRFNAKAQISTLMKKDSVLNDEFEWDTKSLEPRLEIFSGSVILPVINEHKEWQDSDDLSYFSKINALSDDEFMLCMNVASVYEWVDAIYQNDIKAYEWQNELEKRVKIIERLILPDGILAQKAQANELIAPKYPQQLVSVSALNSALATLYEQIARKDESYHTNQSDAVVIDNGDTPKITLNLSYGKNFSIDLTSETKTNFELCVQGVELLNELQGQTGIIVVKGANKLKTALGTGFNVRVALQGLGAFELFSYTVYENKVRLTRS